MQEAPLLVEGSHSAKGNPMAAMEGQFDATERPHAVTVLVTVTTMYKVPLLLVYRTPLV